MKTQPQQRRRRHKEQKRNFRTEKYKPQNETSVDGLNSRMERTGERISELKIEQ